METGVNQPLDRQIECLHTMLKTNAVLYKILQQSRTLPLKEYYIGAGCIAQTVWNCQQGNDPAYGINDIDFVYFDYDTSFAAENTIIETVKQQFCSYPAAIDVKNQARIHLWYKQHFGYAIAPYPSLEAAINTWPTTASAVAVRLSSEDKLAVYAPFGLNDLFSGIVRANKIQITEEIYRNKTERWKKCWPHLTVMPW